MANHTMGLLRPKFFDRQQLTAADLTLGQMYLRERLRRHNYYLHGWGVVCGGVVSTTENAWIVQISEGYVVTPHGDEVSIPANAAPYNIRTAVEQCLEIPPPCAEPENLEPVPVRVARANLDPVGKDTHRDYNREWVELQVMQNTNFNGYIVQHTVNPGTASAAFRTYYIFQESTVFPVGTVIRVHSGAQANHTNPEPGITHRYVASAGQVGTWRLNNRQDTIRILAPTGAVVHTRDLVRPVVYLAVYPHDEETCPQPAVPEKCQPPGGRYEYNRIREDYRFGIVCDLPPSHQLEVSCATLDNIVCEHALVPCPSAPAADDNGVILAALTVSNGGVIEVDNESERQQLLSPALLQAYLRCHCEPPPLPLGRITAIVPAQVEQTGQTITVLATLLGEELAGATQVLFAGSGIQAQVGNNTNPNQLSVVLTILPVTAIGQYAFFVIFPDSRPALGSASFGVFFHIVAGAPPAQPTVFTPPTRFTEFTLFTDFTRFTEFTLFTQPTFATLFTQPTRFTEPTFEPPIDRPPFDLDPVVFDLDRGASEAVDSIPGIGEVRSRQLRAAGVNNVRDFATMSVERAAEVLGISVVRVAALQDAARNRMRHV